MSPAPTFTQPVAAAKVDAPRHKLLIRQPGSIIQQDAIEHSPAKHIVAVEGLKANGIERIIIEPYLKRTVMDCQPGACRSRGVAPEDVGVHFAEQDVGAGTAFDEVVAGTGGDAVVPAAGLDSVVAAPGVDDVGTAAGLDVVGLAGVAIEGVGAVGGSTRRLPVLISRLTAMPAARFAELPSISIKYMA